jgi:pyrroloquinoline quinone (PQQ) biosynthesis protein C
MHLPQERGPISRHVIQALADEWDGALSLALGPGDVTGDEDVQLALWMIYELHYRGFEGVPDDREWDVELLSVRRSIERRFESELRSATRERLRAVADEGDIAAQLLDLVAADDGPPLASFLHRRASREQLLDYLRERSVQQLKESDPQSFVLPRLDGGAKAALAELQYDEYGGGRPERLHATMYGDALEAAGLDRTYGAYVDEVSALSLACTNVMTMFGLNRRLRGAAMGHLAAFEASSSVPSRKIAGGIERLGMPAAVSAYFHEHVEADAVHEHVASSDICGALVTAEPTLRDDVFFGAATSLHLDALSGAELLHRWTTGLEVAS